MSTETPASKPSKALLWTGRVLSAIPVLMMGGIGTIMLFNTGEAAKQMKPFGFPDEAVTLVLILEVSCAVLYAIPQTATLGAILLTAYLGGAVATHVRMSDYSHAVIPVIVGIVVWLGLLLREPRLRALLPIRRI